MSKPTEAVVREEALMLGDHPALDFMNTAARVDGELVDFLQSDRDVVLWLARVGWPLENGLENLRSSALLHAARALREEIRALVERRKAGKRIDTGALNGFLAEARSHLELVLHKNGGLRLERRWKQRTPEQILAPLAELAADLLAAGDFNLVRRCEDEACVLWFYDRTKSHHRRWCSMAACGNRNKVAAFRQRQQRNS